MTNEERKQIVKERLIKKGCTPDRWGNLHIPKGWLVGDIDKPYRYKLGARNLKKQCKMDWGQWINVKSVPYTRMKLFNEYKDRI